ncbi:hypothetical protein [Thiohalocapsa halophila]|nr:hypothetical protein [Thiohalocapsa halophila]
MHDTDIADRTGWKPIDAWDARRARKAAESQRTLGGAADDQAGDWED